MSLEAAETLANPKNKHIISKALMMKKIILFQKKLPPMYFFI
ncbi:hypothetical protein [Methanobrevibacter arboriphilus]|nr:hypothetical protein [Methanobrevibacter arboriphilus]